MGWVRSSQRQIEQVKPTSERVKGGPSRTEPTSKPSLDKTILKIKDSLFKSIELRLRSDVPLAFLLSGGLDSNSLAFISKKYFNYDVNTFSIINKEKRYDESYYINFTHIDILTT